MKVRPIIFSPPMVLALLEGRKTMTRRLAWSPPVAPSLGPGAMPKAAVVRLKPGGGLVTIVPTPWQRVKVGDRFYVRERGRFDDFAPNDPTRYIYFADIPPDLVADADLVRWRPSIHMPRAASRLTLTVTATKVERLMNISEADAKAEGVAQHDEYPSLYRLYMPLPGNAPGLTATGFASISFRSLWGSLHGLASWDANPEVVALTVTVEKRNIDT